MYDGQPVVGDGCSDAFDGVPVRLSPLYLEHSFCRTDWLIVNRWIVAGTTIWSGMGYLFSKDAVRYVATKTASTVGKGKSP